MTTEPVTRSVEIPREAVQAAVNVALADGHNGNQCRPDRNLTPTMHAALTAALPYLLDRVEAAAYEAGWIDAKEDGKL